MSSATAQTIYVNDRRQEILAESTLVDLIRELGLEGKKGVAVAVNGQVVPRMEWGSRSLEKEARVLVIQATQGG
jgi:sulfur carrier protein